MLHYAATIARCGVALCWAAYPALVLAGDASAGSEDAAAAGAHDAEPPAPNTPLIECLGYGLFPGYRTYLAPNNVELQYQWFDPDDGSPGSSIPVVPEFPVLWGSVNNGQVQVPVTWRSVGENLYLGRPEVSFADDPHSTYSWAYRRVCAYQDGDGGAPVLRSGIDRAGGVFTVANERDDSAPEAPVLLEPTFGTWETQAESANCGAYARCPFTIPLGARGPVEFQRLDLGDRVRLFRGDTVVALTVAYYPEGSSMAPSPIKGMLVTGSSCSLKQLSRRLQQLVLPNLDGLSIRVVDAAGNLSAAVAIPSGASCSGAPNIPDPVARSDAGAVQLDAGLASLDAGLASLDAASSTSSDGSVGDHPPKRAQEAGCQLQNTAPRRSSHLPWLALATLALLCLRRVGGRSRAAQRPPVAELT